MKNVVLTKNLVQNLNQFKCRPILLRVRLKSLGQSCYQNECFSILLLDEYSADVPEFLQVVGFFLQALGYTLP